jgi:hypothetical protein
VLQVRVRCRYFSITPYISNGAEKEDILFEMPGLANSKHKQKSGIQPSLDDPYEEILQRNESPKNILICNLPECKTKEV